MPHLQCLSRQSHAALHVVFTTVGGTYRHTAEVLEVVQNLLTSSVVECLEELVALLCRQAVDIRALGVHLVAQHVAQAVVLRLVGLVVTDSVASGVVEDHDVVLLHLAETLHTPIVPLGPLDVRLTFEDGQRVLRQRHRQWCLRNAGAVAHFRHEEVVTR